MKKNLLICLLLFSFSTVFGQMEEFFWAKQTSSISLGNSSQVPLHLSKSVNSGTITAGYFADSIDLDPGSGVDEHSRGDGWIDMYIQSLDSNGNYQFGGVITSLQAGLTLILPVDMEASNQGDIYLTVLMIGEYDLDPGVGITPVSSGTGNFIFMKIDANGNLDWYKQYQNAAPLTIDIDGNDIYTSGAFTGLVDFEPGTAQHILNAGNVTNGYLLKYDAQGNVDKHFHLQSANTNNYITSTSLDGNSNMGITGLYWDSLDLNTGLGVDMHYPNDTLGVFLLKLDSNYNSSWGKTFDGGEQSVQLFDGLIIDDQQNWYSTIRFEDSISYSNNGSTETFYSKGGYDVFIIKVDSNGNEKWAKQFGGVTSNDLAHLNHSNDNSIQVHGYFRDSVDLDLGPNQNMHYGQSNYTPYLINLDSNGTQQSLHVFENEGILYDMLTDGDRKYLLGAFRDTMDVDPGPDTNELTSKGWDGYLIKLGNCSPEYSSDSVQSCNAYTWIDGNTYTESTNTAQFALQGSSGCDSIVTLHFDYTPTYGATDTASSCTPYTWINGETYYESNYSATDTLLNASGCDSVVFLHFDYTPYTSIDTVTSCDSYTWIDGNTYSSDTLVKHMLSSADGCDSIVYLDYRYRQKYGVDNIATCKSSYTWIDGVTYTSNNNTANHTLTSTSGCDSTVYLILTLNPKSGTDSIITCQPYTWIDGITYSSPNNSATFTVSTAQGCDSILTLNLTFAPPTSGTDVVYACQSHTWIDGNTYTSNNNTATYTYTNADGCDSIVTLDLRIGQPQSSTDEIFACKSYTWIDGLTYTSSNNTATHTLQSQHGCDSIVSLDLTIETINTSVTRINKTLSCDQFDATYQWYDCNNELNIPGQTNQSYTAPDSGSYACIITTIDCIDTTDCFDFASLGFDDLSTIDFKLFPNPNSGTFTVDFGQHIDQGDIRILSMDGKLVKVLNFESKSNLTISFEAEPGVYWFEMSSDLGVQRARMIKE